MKQKQNARQRREAEALRRKGTLAPPPSKPSPAPVPEKPPAPKPAARPAKAQPEKTPEEETREFLEYLDRYGTKGAKEDLPRTAKRKPASSGALPRLNLEEGMPTVLEALDRMNLGLQEMRAGHVKAVKLIHGYGSTGRGGKIRGGVREELAAMKRRKQIKETIPGEDFDPTDATSRKLAEQYPSVTRDPDYGRMNHGITIVVL